VLFSAALHTNANAQQQDVQQTQSDMLTKLIADGKKAPKINGQIYRYNKKISSTKAFEKQLKNFSLGFGEKITIVCFWQARDKYSKLLLTKLEQINKKYKSKNVAFYTINTNDFSDKQAMVDFLNAYPITKISFDPKTAEYSEKTDKKHPKPFNIPVIFADQYYKQIYGVTAFPATIAIDKNGFVYTAMIGYFDEYDEWLGVVIDELLKK
jgi:hypothetical protein